MGFLFVFLFFHFYLIFSFDIHISNLFSSAPSGNTVIGTITNPYSSIYSAFLGTKKDHSNATSSEEYHFKIAPSNDPYIINDNEITDGTPFIAFFGLFCFFDFY